MITNDISGVMNNSLSPAFDARARQASSQLSGSSDSQKIKRSATEFESVLLSSWLQAAEKSFATVPGGDPDEDSAAPGKGQFVEFAMQSVASSLANSGGIGIASMIASGLRNTAERANVAPLNEDENVNKTKIRGSSVSEKI